MPSTKPVEPGHPYAATKHISFSLYRQTVSAAPYGYDYFVSLPPKYESQPEKTWPLVLSLHGAGESQRGPNETFACLRHGIPKIILCYDRLKDGNEPAIDIPLASRLRGRNPNKGRNRADADLSTSPVPEEVCKVVAEEFVTLTPVLDMNNGYGWNASVLTSLLDTFLPERRIDLSRVHLTGFSMGGYGTWDLALHTPKRFATLLPICGGGDHLRASQISHVPHWVHHGELDDIIPISQSERMVKALKGAGAKEVRFTRYQDAAHDSWTAAYNTLEVWQWMLGQRNQQRTEFEVLPKSDKVHLEQ
ncbi:Alpha/beta-hydrolase [Pleurostoma richardsiae]|uniref:Alpha/beta-hydrolase n=1 Tax=Pleurostoma richardsiae TaxID=41990 RepID=A0AA38R3B3_9PEZI|nr:Alpha/beta-hydrolase [Pleurostoma richardsiae]